MINHYIPTVEIDGELTRVLLDFYSKKKMDLLSICLTWLHSRN